jgi:hypothetical protein
MKAVAWTIVLLVAANSPAAAQAVTGQGTVAPGEGLTTGATSQGTTSQGAASQGSTSQAPTTGTICEDLMAGTFCNVVGGASNGGYGASNGSGGTVGSASVPTPTPPCGEFPPADELCN